MAPSDWLKPKNRKYDTKNKNKNNNFMAKWDGRIAFSILFPGTRKVILGLKWSIWWAFSDRGIKKGAAADRFFYISNLLKFYVSRAFYATMWPELNFAFYLFFTQYYMENILRPKKKYFVDPPFLTLNALVDKKKKQ